jgi:outer membrane biosynthesis protein TonB
MPNTISLTAAMAAAQSKKNGRIDDLITSLEQAIGEAGLLLEELGGVDDPSLKDNVRVAKIQDAKSRVEAMIRAGHQKPNPRPARESEDTQGQDSNQGRRGRQASKSQDPKPAPKPTAPKPPKPAPKPTKKAKAKKSTPAAPAKGSNPLVKAAQWIGKKG